MKSAGLPVPDRLIIVDVFIIPVSFWIAAKGTIEYIEGEAMLRIT